jgi:eukaryotic-like serine/threonine-protein kinase
LGINTCSIEIHERWLALPPSQGGLGGLSFPLASDETGKVCQAYGVYSAVQKAALRGLFLIDPNGIVQYSVVHGLTVGRSTEEVVRVLDALQTGGLCPSDWVKGEANLDPGRTLGPGSVVGPYRIDGVLGTGAFGTVLRAWDLMLERPVALKVVSVNGTAALETILAEARAAASLNHPNVCLVYSIERGPLVPMIVMEYVDGEPLEKALEDGPLDARAAAALARQIALGMATAHAQGIVHGDLKPGNIMVTPEGVAKIMDFGLARRVPRTTSESGNGAAEVRSTGLSGTPMYMSPEQAGGAPATPASDVFAMGLVLFEMVTGRAAVRGKHLADTLSQIRELDASRYVSEVSDPFAKLIGAALVRDPLERRITMADIASALAP